MYWYYSEGELTVKLDGEEHKFSLDQLIRDSSVYKERRRLVKITFISLFFATLFMQLYGGGIPEGQDHLFLYRLFYYPLNNCRLLLFLNLYFFEI